MFVSDITEPNFPQVHLNARISSVLQLMEDYDVQHISTVTEDEIFAGLISKEDLLDADSNNIVSSLQHKLIMVSVQLQDFFLSALKIAVQFEISVVPVIQENGELHGSITSKKLLQTVNNFFGAEERGALIVLEMDKHDFSFGEICRLIETNNAWITQLNTCTDITTGMLLVTVRINKKEVADIIATLQRYDYNIRSFFGEEMYENDIKKNFDLLMNYLSI